MSKCVQKDSHAISKHLIYTAIVTSGIQQYMENRCKFAFVSLSFWPLLRQFLCNCRRIFTIFTPLSRKIQLKCKREWMSHRDTHLLPLPPMPILAQNSPLLNVAV